MGQAVLEQKAGSCCGPVGGALCRMGLIAATLHLRKYRKIGCFGPLGCSTVCAGGEGQSSAELSMHAASLQLCVPPLPASVPQRHPEPQQPRTAPLEL